MLYILFTYTYLISLYVQIRVLAFDRTFESTYLKKSNFRAIINPTKVTDIQIYRRTTKKKTFACQFCPEKFFENTELVKHEKTKHDISSQRPQMFRCKFCDKSFSRLWLLKDHENLHSNQKPYSCHICGAF